MSLSRSYHSTKMKSMGRKKKEQEEQLKTEEVERSQKRVRGYNIEEVMEKRRVKSCRRQMTGGGGGGGESVEARRRRVKANLVSAL